MKSLTIILICAAFAVGCRHQKEESGDITITEGAPINIPKGYHLIEASWVGVQNPLLTLYVQNDEGRIYEYFRNGNFGKEIRIPKGYKLVGVAETGRSTWRKVFFLQNVAGEVFEYQKN